MYTWIYLIKKCNYDAILKNGRIPFVMTDNIMSDSRPGENIS